MKNAKTSGFQFSNPKMKKLVFQINENYDSSKYEGMPVSYEIGIVDQAEESAIVELQVVVGILDGATPFYVELTNCAEFRWTNDIEEFSEKLLKHNAAILLMSYARPVIAHIVGDAGFKPFNLPFLDMRED